MERMHFRARRIPHFVVCMVMALVLSTKVPDGVWGALNVFLFPGLSPSIGSKAFLLTRRLDAVLGDNTFTAFADTGSILGQKKSS